MIFPEGRTEAEGKERRIQEAEMRVLGKEGGAGQPKEVGMGNQMPLGHKG